MDYDIIVIGAGHAGVEAALACARMGCKTLMVTFKIETIGLMSCNPAIGGVGKGQLVKEIDALGGQMGKAADACGIQFRILNASKGPAVQSSRAQVDRHLYKKHIRRIVGAQDNLSIKETQIRQLWVKDNKIIGVITSQGENISSLAVVLCPGTFLDGLIHVGLKHFSGGRIGEPAAIDLTSDLRRLGFRLQRFKTGTCPRIDKATIDFSKTITQDPDKEPQPFSFSTKRLTQVQVPCYITYTNKQTHGIIRDNLDKSPLYSGIIKATGVRYCPSIEDKVFKFSQRTRHQIFLEPEGYESNEIYPNGLSTSLPQEVQLKMLRSIEGLKEAKVTRFGYAIEHTVVDPTQAYPTLETKLIGNLFLAGQINGTTGYEEAAAQGLVAGINAALKVRGMPALILDRASSYAGVLIDDLTTKGTNEPYRMFTSRVEYRLILREDNADMRLRKLGHDLGLVSAKDYAKLQKKEKAVREGMDFLKSAVIKPSSRINQHLEGLNTSPIRKAVSLEMLLRRPQVTLRDIKGLGCFDLAMAESACRQIEIQVKYAGFIQRQVAEVERFKNLEKVRLPADFDYNKVNSLSREIKEKLNEFKPVNLGQASRISGVTPAAISILTVYLRKISHV